MRCLPIGKDCLGYQVSLEADEGDGKAKCDHLPTYILLIHSDTWLPKQSPMRPFSAAPVRYSRYRGPACSYSWPIHGKRLHTVARSARATSLLSVADTVQMRKLPDNLYLIVRQVLNEIERRAFYERVRVSNRRKY